MSTPDSQLPNRVARPNPADERGRVRLILDTLPMPAPTVDTGSGQTVVANPTTAR